MLLTVITPTADILGNPQEPDVISKKDSQLLFGEQFHVEESHGPYVFGHSVHDNYKGYIERDQLVKNIPLGTKFVTVKSTHLYSEPNFRSRPLASIGFMSRLPVTETTADNFTQLVEGQWVYTKHFEDIEDSRDLADVASLYMGTPYLYGGRSVMGIDCSGLVQNCLIAKGYGDIPRDAKDQEDSFGKPVKKEDMKRNDIVYFKGHVGVMLDEKRILNATERHMGTVIEDVQDLEKIYGGITHIVRV